MLLDDAFPDATFREAESVDAMLKMIRENDDFDLVLMDLMMPGTSVYSGLWILKREYPNVPVVIVSSSENASDVWATFEAGAVGYILKSSPANVFKNALQLVLWGDRYIPPIVVERGLASRQGSFENARCPSNDFGDAIEHYDELTRRQQEVLAELAKGLTNKEIARKLGLLEGTVKIHVKAILRKLKVRNRTEAVVVGQREGLISGVSKVM